MPALFPALALLFWLAGPTFAQDAGPGDYLDRGIRLYRSGDLSGAAKELKHAVGLDPRQVLAHYHLAKIHLLQQDIYKAFYALREVLALEPNNKRARKLLAELSPQLISRLESDIKNRKDIATAYNVMGFLLICQNRLGEGVRREQYALQLEPRMAEAYDDLAWAAYKDRDLEKAFQMASKAFELDPVKGSITAHYQQLFNLKRLGVPFNTASADTQAADPGTIERAAVDPGAVQGYPTGALPVGAAPLPLQATDIRGMAGEDEALVKDYLKNAELLTQSTPPGKFPIRLVAPGAGTTPPPRPALDRKRKVAGETQKVLQETYDKARKREDARDFQQALALYSTIEKSDRGFLDVPIRIVEVNRAVEAVRAYDDAVAALKGNQFETALASLKDMDRRALIKGKGLSSVENLIGEAALGAHRYDVAKVALEHWLADRPRDAHARFLLVKTFQSVGEYSAALDQLREIINNDPNYARDNSEIYTLRTKLWVKAYFLIVFLLAALWFALTAAYAYVKYKRGSRARTARRLVDRVQKAMKKERWADVITEVEKAGAVNLQGPEEVFIGCSLGTAYLHTGDLTRAVKLQRELLEAFGEEPTVHHLTARVMLNQKDFSSEAIEEYQRLLSVEPNNRTLLEVLNSHYQSHDPESEEALKILDRLLELDPTSTEFRYYRALRYLRQKDFSEAAHQAYVRLLEVDPGRSDIRYGLARALFEKRNYLEVIKEAKRSMETDLDTADLHRILIASYMRLSMQAEAIKEYRQLIARHPERQALKSYLEQIHSFRETPFADEHVAREAEALYEKGVRAYQEGRHKDAIASLTAAFNTEHLRLSAGTLLVRSYLKTRELKTAITLFERLDILDNKTPEEYLLSLCYDMAEIYLKEGKKDKALELYTFICRTNVSYKDAFARLEDLQPSSTRV